MAHCWSQLPFRMPYCRLPQQACGALLLAATAVGFAGQPPDSYVRSWPPCMPCSLAWAQTWSPRGARGIKQRARLAVQPLDPALRPRVPAIDSTPRQYRGCTLAERVLQRSWCQLHLPCVSDAGPDEDLLRVDVAFAEGITQNEPLLEQVTEDALALLKSALNPDNQDGFDDEAELSVVLCDDAYIRELNRQWRSKDAATDVLSFPQQAENGILGDLVLSLDTAKRQADERQHDLRTEIRILMLHGLLHLLGYDHETSHEDLEEMSQAEVRLLDRLGWQGSGLISSVGFDPSA